MTTNNYILTIHLIRLSTCLSRVNYYFFRLRNIFLLLLTFCESIIKDMILRHFFFILYMNIHEIFDTEDILR